MNPEDVISLLTKILKDLNKGRDPSLAAAELSHCYSEIQDPALKELVRTLAEFTRTQHAAAEFIQALAQGNLSVEPPKNNNWVSPFKDLQANLLHLSWQVQRISERDYNQHIDFLGDFSLYLEKLITSLKEKKVLEQELKSSEEKFRLITENVNDVIWILNATHEKFTYFSPALFTLRGYTPDEARQMNIYDELYPESAQKIIALFRERMKKFLENPAVPNVYIDQLERPYKQGGSLWIEISTKFRLNAEGEVEILGVSRNIDDRKRMEFEIKEKNQKLAELNATREKFFHIIAHDLINPFNIILGFSERLMELVKKDNQSRIAPLAESIYNTGQSTYKLLQNLLEWSRAQTGTLEFSPVSLALNPMLHEVLDITSSMAQAKEIHIKETIPPGFTLFADKNMLSTVLRNLITNAIKFTKRGGTIQISSGRTAEEVHITVADNGTGMNALTMEQLFTMRDKTSIAGTEQEKGTGLGLILCHEFVTRHGGKITVESEPGKGSKFTVTLPAGS